MRRIKKDNTTPLFFLLFQLLVVFMPWRSAINKIMMKSSSTSTGILPGVQAFPSTPTTTTTTASNQFRILCFGDSLTAGTSPLSRGDHPYAPHLETTLRQSEQFSSNDRSVMIRHMGYPGWTARQLLDTANDERGLRTLIRRVKDPSLSLVILLAGTNDLGYGFPPDRIAESIQSLHELCVVEGVPRTIAIGIPPSAFQKEDADFAKTARQTNEKIEEYCRLKSNGRSSFMKFPFDWSDEDDRWSSDGLHFSPKGYQVLGESLAPVVERMVQQLETDSAAGIQGS